MDDEGRQFVASEHTQWVCPAISLVGETTFFFSIIIISPSPSKQTFPHTQRSASDDMTSKRKPREQHSCSRVVLWFWNGIDVLE